MDLIDVAEVEELAKVLRPCISTSGFFPLLLEGHGDMLIEKI